MSPAAPEAPRQTAATALALGALGASVLLAAAPFPLAADAAALQGPLPPVTAWPLPLGDGASRDALLARLLQLVLGLCVVWTGYQVFRGPGRFAAAVGAGWASAIVFSAAPLPQGGAKDLLAASLLTLAAGTALRALVRFGCVPPVARLRALSLAAVASPLAPGAAWPVLVLLAAVSALRARSDTGPPSASRIAFGSFTLASWLVSALVLAGAWSLYAVAAGPAPTAPAYGLSWPGPGWSATVPAGLAYPALALGGLLVLPLRWRGGLTLVALLLGAFFIHDGDELAAPGPVRVALLCGCAGGWIRLAGTMTRGKPRLALGLSAAGTAVVVALASAGTLPVAPAPTTAYLPARSFPALLARGLMAPGDVVFLWNPWTRDIVRAKQEREGFRPDVTVVDGPQLERVMVETAGFTAAGRRVLSDSFNAGGAWDPKLVADSGPLFWFVGDQTGTRNDFIALDAFSPAARAALPAPTARAWEALHVERARFWRRRGLPDEALRALPLGRDELDMLSAARRRAAGQRPRSDPTTELPGHMGPDDRQPGALVWAEAGDVLLASGASEIGGRLLLRAASLGHPDALSALARWRLRATSRFDSRDLLNQLAGEPRYRDVAADLVSWLADRGRLEEAHALLDAFAPGTDQAAIEIATRLRVLTARVAPGPGPPGDPRPDLRGLLSPPKTAPAPP